MTTNDGGPAFPLQDWDPAIHSQRLEHGMSLRDYFAAKALQALISKIPLHDKKKQLGIHAEEGEIESLQADVSESAYGYADAMLAAREKGQG